MRNALNFRWLLGLGLLLVCSACGGNKANDQTAARILANPYNSKVRGNLYHSRWRDLELEFSTRAWRVEGGEYALHLVAKDKYSQVLLGSRFHLLATGSLEKAARKQLKKLGMRDFEILTQEPTKIQGLDALVVTARGQFLIDYFRDLRVDRKVRLLITRTSRRVIWMAYISTEPTFPEYLQAAAELEQKLRILSQPMAGDMRSSGGNDARLDVALGENAGTARP